MKPTLPDRRLIHLLFQGLSAREIAHRLNVSEEETHATVRRLLRNLRAAPRGDQTDPPDDAA